MQIKPYVEINEGALPIQITGNPLLDRIYQNRGITSPDEVQHSLSRLISPFKMKGMREAADVIIPHIMKKSRILIVGDYDCDGATATSIAVEGLHMLGAKDVRFIVPDRQIHGYGLSPDVVKLAGEYKPDLIITVDNGIASFEGAEAVYNLPHPCQLVITDHHLTAENGKVPRAEAIVNPNQPGCTFPSKAIAGCGVMLYVIIGLRSRMRELGLLDELGLGNPRIEKLLDLAALGTIADVVALDYNNRVIVSAGLELMNSGAARLGIRKLLELAGRKIGEITSSDMGFVVGPRLNAAGRLDDMTHGIRMLLETNEEKAEEMAKFLDDMNRQRKEMQREMVKEANEDLGDNVQAKGVVVYNGDWHEGIVGLLASNIKEKTNRPVICITNTHGLIHVKEELEDKNLSPQQRKELEERLETCLIKGSARSVPGVHMKHVLDAISKKHPHILSKFGGHAMAAGLSIEKRHLAEFTKLFDQEVAKVLTDEMIRGKCEVDVLDMPDDWISIENAELISRSGPWGAQFQEPLFGGNFVVESYRKMGTNNQHAKLFLKSKHGDKLFEAVWFNCIDKEEPPFYQGNEVQCSFVLSINEWKGRSSIQLMVRHLQDPEFIRDHQFKTEFTYDHKLDESGVKKMGIAKRIDANLSTGIGF
ncbi:DHH family phosphoesterase [Pseudomonas luteola]